MSNWAVTGLYFYDQPGQRDRRGRSGPRRAANWRSPTSTSVYLEAGALHVERLSRGCAWLDAGTPDSLLQAATFVQTIQSRTGMLVGCPEEVAFRMGFIDADALRGHARAPRQDRTGPRADGTGGREHGMNVEAAGDPGCQAADAAALRAMRAASSPRPGTQARFADAGVPGPFVQDNHALSARARHDARPALQIAPTCRASWCAWCAARSGTWRWTSGAARRPTASMSRRC